MPDKMITDAGNRLASDYGLVGILILALIASSYLMIRWFQAALKEQRADYLEMTKNQRKESDDWAALQRTSFGNTLKEQREAFLQSLRDERDRTVSMIEKISKAHEDEMGQHMEQMKEWRQETVTESRAMRDMLQMWVNRMALSRAVDESNAANDALPAAERKPRKQGGTT